MLDSLLGLLPPSLVPYLPYLAIILCILLPGLWPLFAKAGASATASHILVKDEEFCEKLAQEIGQDLDKFKSKAREHSQCPSRRQGGHLGKFTQGQMVPAFDRLIFDPATELGRVYGPVQTHFGYHLIVVHEGRPHK